MHIPVVEDLPTTPETSSSIPSTGTKRKGQSPLSSHTLFLLWIPASLGPLFHGSVKPHPLLLACVSQLDLICITPQFLVGGCPSYPDRGRGNLSACAFRSDHCHTVTLSCKTKHPGSRAGKDKALATQASPPKSMHAQNSK